MRQSYVLSEQAHLDLVSVDRRVKPRVMVVDDTDAQRYAVVRALRNEGFDVVEACTGGEALALSALMPLDAVVLDVHLPDLDGYDVCRRLKAASAVMLPVLHLSSTATSEAARARGLDAGADSYLTHPFDPNVLRAAVSALVRLKRQESARLAQVAATSLLQESLDALGDHIALLGPTGDIVALNAAWGSFATGNEYADDTAGLGLNYCDVCDAATGVGGDGAHEAVAGIRAVLAGTRDQFEVDYPCHSPTVQRWFRMKVCRVHGPGPVAAIITHTDKTAEHQRNQSDARFRRFVETAHEGVLAMDAVGRITYANPCSGQLLGFAPGELEGRQVFEFMTPDAEFEARTRFAGRWTGDAKHRVELQVRQRDGSVLDLLVAESPIRDDEGGIVGVLAMLSDVTARNAAQRAMGDALHEADMDRRRLAATLEAIPVGVWLADATGRLTHTNPAADRVWGGPAPRVAGVAEYGEYRATWPATGARIAPREWALARTLATGETILGEMVEIERFDGTRGFVLNSAAPILDADGVLTGGVVVNVDITVQQAAAHERDRLVASLEREREHLSAIFTQAPSFFAVARGPAHVFERVNPAYQQLIGDRDVIGMSVAEAMPELVSQGFIDLLDRVRATGEPFIGSQIPVQLVRSSGAAAETRYIDFVYQQLQEPDGDHALVAHGVDVTDSVLATEQLRVSEALLREQFAKLPVPTYLWERRGDDFVLIDCNEASAASLPNFSTAMFGQTQTQLFPSQRGLHQDMHESLRTNAVVRRSLEIVLADTSTRSLDFTMGPQQPDRVLVHVNDTTERMGLEAQLRQAQKMEAVGLLAGGVAHDFNNLLTVIGAHASFLLDTLDASDPQREDAEAIHKAGVRAAGLTRQLLAFSRKQILKPRLVDLNAVLADTHQMLARLLGEDIEIATSFAPDLPHVVADPGQVEQVLVNLAVNARDAMPDGGHLALTTRLMTVAPGSAAAGPMVPPGEYVMLEVTDTGTGMSPEVQARLFEPFFTTKPAGRGTGLGLATAYGIVKQSSGYITVASVPGRGSSFRVLLPAVRAAEAHEQLREAERAVVRGVETVLVVEDEAGIRAAAKRMLQRFGYVVLEAPNGEAALALSAAFDAPIHLVVSDAVMPGIGGVETVRRLQAQRPSLKALFISGYTDDEIVRRGIVSSSLRFVQKPFTAADFGRAVREALEDRIEEA